MTKIETQNLDSARDFLRALQRSIAEWYETGTFDVPWIFRGVRDADWEWNLVPSAWRPCFRNRYKWLFDSCEKEVDDAEVQHELERQPTDYQTPAHRDALRNAWIQNGVECTLVEAFCDFAEKLRFRLPGGEPPVFRRKVWYFEFGTFNTKMHPAFGLAQHHLIPTRLLDWTMNPMIAAFFAAEQASPSGGGRIAVFALDPRKIDVQRNRFQVFTVPRSDIDYLYAQRGLFTFFELADYSFSYKLKWPRFDDANSLKEGGLRKITLPHAEVPELVRLLWGEEVTRAHLMPTLDNVAVALKEMWSHYSDGWFSASSGTP